MCAPVRSSRSSLRPIAGRGLHVSQRRRAAGHTAQKRGKAWERHIQGRLDLLARSGVAYPIRTPETMTRLGSLGKGRWECVASSKGPPDYVVCYQGRGILLEAKHTRDDRLKLSLLRVHQAQHLEAWQRHGGVSGLLVSIQGLSLAVPWTWYGPRWRAWHTDPGRAPQGTASLTVDELRAHSMELDIAGRWLAWLLEPTPVSPEAQPPLPEENPLWDASTC